jgi:hypothetical protein
MDFLLAQTLSGFQYVALQKLQRTHRECSLYEERTGDISALVWYVCEELCEIGYSEL